MQKINNYSNVTFFMENQYFQVRLFKITKNLFLIFQIIYIQPLESHKCVIGNLISAESLSGKLGKLITL